MVTCGGWEAWVGELVISQRMFMISAIKRFSYILVFILNVQTHELEFGWLKSGIAVLGFCMGINVMLINENEIIEPSWVKHKINKRSILALELWWCCSFIIGTLFSYFRQWFSVCITLGLLLPAILHACIIFICLLFISLTRVYLFFSITYIRCRSLSSTPETYPVGELFSPIPLPQAKC